MNRMTVLAHQLGEIKPSKVTGRQLGKTVYAVTSCGAWVRVTLKPSKKRMRF